jgi:hypothetical protein
MRVGVLFDPGSGGVLLDDLQDTPCYVGQMTSRF